MSSTDRPRLTAIELGADPASWAGAGFTVVDGCVNVDGVSIELVPGLVGVASLSFDRLPEGVESLDGVKLHVAPLAGSAEHANGAVRIDQVVLATPEFERTAEALAGLGLALRREAVRKVDDDEGGDIRQGFVRAGGPVIELVHTKRVPVGPAHVWGLGFISDRFDHALAELDGVIGKPRPAVQPGRRIATFVRDSGLGLPVVLLDPEPEIEASRSGDDPAAGERDTGDLN